MNLLLASFCCTCDLITQKRLSKSVLLSTYPQYFSKGVGYLGQVRPSRNPFVAFVFVFDTHVLAALELVEGRHIIRLQVLVRITLENLCYKSACAKCERTISKDRLSRRIIDGHSRNRRFSIRSLKYGSEIVSSSVFTLRVSNAKRNRSTWSRYCSLII